MKPQRGLEVVYNQYCSHGCSPYQRFFERKFRTGEKIIAVISDLKSLLVQANPRLRKEETERLITAKILQTLPKSVSNILQSQPQTTLLDITTWAQIFIDGVGNQEKCSAVSKEDSLVGMIKGLVKKIENMEIAHRARLNLTD